jgi:prevent-host-death family protein
MVTSPDLAPGGSLARYLTEVHMDSGACTTAPFDDVWRRFEHYLDQANAGPVLVERDGVPGVVMLSASEYERLARLDHLALLPSELDQEDLAALRDAVVTVRE